MLSREGVAGWWAGWRGWLEPALKVAGGLVATVAVAAPMAMMVMDRAQEAQQRIQIAQERVALQQGQQQAQQQAQELRQREAEQGAASAELARQRLLVEFWAPHREVCMGGAAAASAVASTGARDRRALEGWAAAAAGPLASVPDAGVRAAAAAFSDGLSCGRACEPAALWASAGAIWRACGCLACGGAPDLCGGACAEPAASGQ